MMKSEFTHVPAGAAAVDPALKAQLEESFREAMPGSRAVEYLDAREGFVGAAAGVIAQETFGASDARDSEPLTGFRSKKELKTIKEVVERFGGSGNRFGKDFLEKAQRTEAEREVLVLHARRDPAARRFVELLGQVEASHSIKHFEAKTDTTRYLPRNPSGGDYWDLGSGLNATRHILKELEPGSHYVFHDLSPFVVTCLKAAIAHKGADAEAVQSDVMTLRPPKRLLAVLRAKNMENYVSGFAGRLAKMTDWIRPGGRLILQNEPQPDHRELLIKSYTRLARRMIEKGWRFSFELGARPDAEHGFDTLIWSRPSRARAVRSEEARRQWDAFVGAARTAQ